MIYDALTKFLQAQERYRVDIDTRSERPLDVSRLVESTTIYLLSKSPRADKPSRDMGTAITEEMSGLRRNFNFVEKWIKEGTGLKPSRKQEPEFGRGDISYPELVYTQALTPSKITVSYRTSRGKDKRLTLQGKNELEVKVVILTSEKVER